MLVVVEDFIAVEVLHDATMYDVFQHFARYGREGHRAVIAGLVFLPLLVDGYYTSVSSVSWHLTSVQRALEQSRQGRCNLFSCGFKDKGRYGT